ncbi:MAG: sulfatase-like hydrolase/transferase [Candidatus Solibacter usitatus]|nr:sulfatase-like hydrolase/transferase [Candidatus Solibacter usitatus]
MNLTRRSFLTTAASPLLAQKSAPPAARPNIVLVVADDLAAWMTGCYGNTEIRTPNIDRLAAGGTRFVNNFVCTPICSASRATLFTGRTPSQHGIHDFLSDKPATNPDQGQLAPPASFANEVMISDLLAQAGYKCGYAGKWHMGNDASPGHGFTYTATIGARSYQDPVINVNGSAVNEKGYLADVLTRHATGFIDQQSKGTPFFLTVGYLNPHTPYEGHPQKYYDMYKDAKFESFGIQPAAANALREKSHLAHTVESLRKCAASVTALDDQIPVLQRKLMEKGLFDNTIFIFTGDNGYLLGRHGLWSKGHASNPINMYEEAMQVPMIWQWPGRVPVHAVRPELVSFYDFVPSICEATGVKPPAGRNLCGRSYLPLATNRPLPKKEPWRELVFGQFRYAWMARDNYFKLVVRNEGEGPNELYDLKKDPREQVNLYEHPGFVTVRDGLARRLAEWRQKYSS